MNKGGIAGLIIGMFVIVYVLLKLFDRFIVNQIANKTSNTINIGLNKLGLPPNPNKTETKSAIKSCARVLNRNAKLQCLLLSYQGSKYVKNLPSIDLQNMSVNDFDEIARTLGIPDATREQIQTTARELGIHDLREPVQAVEIPFAQVNTISQNSLYTRLSNRMTDLPTATLIGSTQAIGTQRHSIFRGGKSKKIKNTKKNCKKTIR
jgi:hypothetical protein